jgi:Ran GTPase-activating protein (RanGAP) involved in mRNA processing and transport
MSQIKYTVSYRDHIHNPTVGSPPIVSDLYNPISGYKKKEFFATNRELGPDDLAHYMNELGNQQLTDIYLQNNNFGDTEDNAKIFRAFFLKNCREAQYINLSNNKIGTNVADVLMLVLTHCKHMTSVDLRNTEISSSDLKSLEEAYADICFIF